MSYEKCCRLCLLECDVNAQKIDCGKIPELCSNIEFVLDIKITPMDSNTIICDKCFGKIIAYHTFKKSAVENQKLLKDYELIKIKIRETQQFVCKQEMVGLEKEEASRLPTATPAAVSSTCTQTPETALERRHHTSNHFIGIPMPITTPLKNIPTQTEMSISNETTTSADEPTQSLYMDSFVKISKLPRSRSTSRASDLPSFSSSVLHATQPPMILANTHVPVVRSPSTTPSIASDLSSMDGCERLLADKSSPLGTFNDSGMGSSTNISDDANSNPSSTEPASKKRKLVCNSDAETSADDQSTPPFSSAVNGEKVDEEEFLKPKDLCNDNTKSRKSLPARTTKAYTTMPITDRRKSVRALDKVNYFPRKRIDAGLTKKNTMDSAEKDVKVELLLSSSASEHEKSPQPAEGMTFIPIANLPLPTKLDPEMDEDDIEVITMKVMRSDGTTYIQYSEGDDKKPINFRSITEYQMLDMRATLLRTDIFENLKHILRKSPPDEQFQEQLKIILNMPEPFWLS